MARHLIKRQIKYIDSVIPFARCVENIPTKYWNVLVSMNDYETIYQDINRYLHDKEAERDNKKDPWS